MPQPVQRIMLATPGRGRLPCRALRCTAPPYWAIIPAVSGHERGRIVYSTGSGRLCPACGWPAADCRCSGAIARGSEPVPARITAKLRIETKGRGGKIVTVVDGLPRNDALLRELAAELKKACGTGGSAGDGSVELQGDRRERLRVLLAARGFLVKG